MVKLTICGDFRASQPEGIVIDSRIKTILKESDYNIVNFEAPISPLNGNASLKSGPALSQSRKSPDFLRENGFNVVLLANNHIMDFGKSGCDETIKSLNGFITLGAGESEDAFTVRYINKDGIRIGLLSLVQFEFGVVRGKNEESYGTAWINSPDISDIIKEAKSKCEYLLIFPHAGVEHTIAPLPEWRQVYKRFIDWGADGVFASHPHCPQGWELYKGKPVYYSLGDFYFDELTYDDFWYKSIMLELSFEESLLIKEHYICFNDKTRNIKIDESRLIFDYIGNANNLLRNKADYEKYINNLCAEHWSGMKYGLLRGLCGVSLKMRVKYIVRLLGCMLLGNKNEMYLLNLLQCESHRWVLERYLKNNNLK